MRPINPDDWREWRSIRLRALCDAPGAFGTSYAEAAGPKDREQYWRGYFSATGRNYLAELDGDAVGLARITGPGPDTDAELLSLWVAPAARGHGIGAGLVEACWTWLQSAAPGASLRLNVVRDNHDARRLYERLGFTCIGADPDDPGEDVLVKRPGSQSVGE
jgi:ribosomal protein S18 acetylase RimI-like enzyme